MVEFNMLWQHPYGDVATVPCAHLRPAHPEGHPVRVPCTHPPVAEHPHGDKVTIRCVHPGTQHGQDEIRTPWGKKKIPCVHPGPQHPGGDEVTVPCIHLRVPHPDGDEIMAPCVHLVQEHPEGHEAPAVPCVHFVPDVEVDTELHIVFHTGNQFVRDQFKRAVRRLKELGVPRIGNPLRPLHVCTLDWAPGLPHDHRNPAWSHYNPALHGIQIAPSRVDTPDTFFHELGHALIGARLVRMPGGSHEIKTSSSPELAMSEGWAHFVGLAISNFRTSADPEFKGQEWEARDPAVEKRDDIEYNVASLLWDLYDKNSDQEKASFSFAQLFSVYSPTLEAVLTGNEMGSIHRFLKLLKERFPDKAAEVDRVADIHLSNKILATPQVGGAGGTEFRDDTTDVDRISRVFVRAGDLIDAIQCEYELRGGGIRVGALHGGQGGTLHTITIPAGQRLAIVEGQHTGAIVKQLTFVTDANRRFSVGPPGRLWIDVPSPTGWNRVAVTPGAASQFRWHRIPVQFFAPADARVGSTLVVSGVGEFMVQGENALRFDLRGYRVLGVCGRSGALLDALGLLFA